MALFCLLLADAGHPGPWRSFLLGRHEAAVMKYMRTGQFREALKHRQKMLAMQKVACDSDDRCRLLAAFGRYPDATLAVRRPSTVRGERKDGRLFVPVTVNSTPASYILDTGANFSVLTESEAKRLGLPVTPVNGGKIGDPSGNGVAITHIAVAETLKLGEMQFQHVPFLVLSDDSKVWSGLPPGWRGALGIQVLLACETVAWTADGTVRVGERPARTNRPHSDLTMHASNVYATAAFDQRKLNLYLDTGSSWSCLYESFTKAVPALVTASGKPGTRRFSGAGGETEVPSTVLPEVALRLGGFTATLRPAEILKRPEPHHGVIGLDLLDQARAVSIDFKAKKLILE